MATTQPGASRRAGGRDPEPQGFTLIELLVVVSIIALLIAILLPALAGAKRQGLKSKCAANLSGIGRAAMMFAANHNDDMPSRTAPRWSVTYASCYFVNGQYWVDNNDLSTLSSPLNSSGTPRDNCGITNQLEDYRGDQAADAINNTYNFGTPTSPKYVCPAPVTVNPMSYLYNAPGFQIGRGYNAQGKPWAWGTYMYFFKNVAADGVDAQGNTYQPIMGARKVSQLVPSQVLAQDRVQKGWFKNWSGAGSPPYLPMGNHEATGVTPMPDNVPPTLASGSNFAQEVWSGYFQPPTLQGLSGANVLFGDWSVRWVPIGQLVPVTTGTVSSPSSSPTIMYIGQ